MKDHFAAFDNIIRFPGRGMGCSCNGYDLIFVIVMRAVSLCSSVSFFDIHISNSNNTVKILACRADVFGGFLRSRLAFGIGVDFQNIGLYFQIAPDTDYISGKYKLLAFILRSQFIGLNFYGTFLLLPFQGFLGICGKGICRSYRQKGKTDQEYD